MDISKTVKQEMIHPMSKHLLYEFGFYEGSPALCIDVITLVIDRLTCVPFPDSSHEVCDMRGTVQSKKSTQHLIVIDRDNYDIVLIERDAHNIMSPYKSVTDRPTCERAREPYYIDITLENRCSLYGECSQLCTICKNLLDKIPNIQSLTSEVEFTNNIKYWIREYMLPYILRKDDKGDDDNG